MQPNKNIAIGLITLCLLAIGFFSVVLIKAYYQHNKADDVQEASLPSLIQLEMENEKLTQENENLWEELTKLQAADGAAALASQQLEEASINACLVGMTGPGIKIILDDSREERIAEAGNYVIHEEYLSALVNALWNGGAEAIAINNQRLTAHTEIFCSGSYIQINGTRQMPPYHIVAIGNQENLKSALQFYLWDKLGEYQQLYGITRKLETPKEPLTVPAAKQFTFKYAQPVKEG
ncbi:MAG: DUF881 domain-containing protein [Peptococcaceae bacterium]|nr:DUF881 domain-containing protein [Peptococcaceae bacterium]